MLLGLLLVLFFLTAGFFVISAVLMGTWNYTIPRLITSVEGSNTYTDINYTTAMVFTILLGLFFGGGGLMMSAPMYCVMPKKGKKDKKTMASYTANTDMLSGGPFY
jgi:ABC-type spermidine/putrescine transport system permease subunit I